MTFSDNKFVTGFITTDTIDSARKISTMLLEKKLIACANIIPGVESHYWWQGSLQRSQEYILLIKTKPDYAAKINQEVHAIHSYEVPCIAFYDIENINGDFADWMKVILKEQ